MRSRGRKIPFQFGHAEIGMSRYVVLYLAQAGWVVLGWFLASRSLWPSTCQPDGILKAYMCSFHLPDNRGWVEAALFTWMWSTPLLITLVAIGLLRRSGLLRQR
ncbi:conserved hypothetical protein [Altererythrobacter sp. B11]|uniref:hypothetical protein n=1 Tax=Altererythrobacter sp. B11 TaxID=2060312 RepID=UPI000DC725D0|nr:hypothetical protein [Altererythrobacter sp. B11]BBC71062.1 conserved hypothetical protein [Altererythrobacter sp. B11]